MPIQNNFNPNANNIPSSVNSYVANTSSIGYYNTSAPTPSTLNTINSVSSNIRDYLLNLNLNLITSNIYQSYNLYNNVTNNYSHLSTSINGSPHVGEPVVDTSSNNNSVTVPIGLPLETNGVTRYQIAVLGNTFVNNSSTATNLVSINNNVAAPSQFTNSSWPIGSTTYPTGVNGQIDSYGILAKSSDAGFLKNSTLMNLYLDQDAQIDAGAFIDLQVGTYNTQIKGYLNQYGALNVGSNGQQMAVQASDVVGSLLTGNGLGITNNGVSPNFDLRTSLAGRVLGATGVITDTKLGNIGAVQLGLALANNAAFNTEASLLGKLNIGQNALSLVKTGKLDGLRPNYKITVPNSAIGQAADYTARILGFTLPKSYLNAAGSVFQFENDDASIVERDNAMITNTGKGQIVALVAQFNASLNGTGSSYDNPNNPNTNPFRSGYAPAINDNNGKPAVNANLYAFDDGRGNIIDVLSLGNGVIPTISYNRTKLLAKDSFGGPTDVPGTTSNGYSSDGVSSLPSLNKTVFSWGTKTGGAVNSGQVLYGDNYQSGDWQPFPTTTQYEKSLLSKTQKLFNDIGMKNIVSGFGNFNAEASQIQSGVVGGNLSKGSAVMQASSFDKNSGTYNGSKKTPENTFCRAWTPYSRYSNVNNLVRSSGLNGNVPYRNQYNGSVLDDNGFVKIGPYSTDDQTKVDVKKFMLSIENLAWADNLANLLPIEQGPGDPLTGIRGRIMWFPPYDIQFSEQNSVNWEASQFIGRGENIYTYNNTERGGSLSFKIVVDHPTYINSFRGSKGPDDHYMASFFAGCLDPDSNWSQKLTVSEKSTVASTLNPKPQTANVTNVPSTPQGISVYYPNDSTIWNATQNGVQYESGICSGSPINYTVYSGGCGLGPYTDTTHVISSTAWNDGYNFGLNGNTTKISIGNNVYSGFSDSNLMSGLNSFMKTTCPSCIITVNSYASPQGPIEKNTQLAMNRTTAIINYLKSNLDSDVVSRVIPGKSSQVNDSECVSISGNPNTDCLACKKDRRSDLIISVDPIIQADLNNNLDVPLKTNFTQIVTEKITNRFYNEQNYFDKLTSADSFVFDKFRDKIKYFHPAFHSTTPEGLNSRLTFLNQCTRQGPTLESQGADNLAFGRPPVCILRIGDFYNTKIIIDSLNIDYEPLQWDLNPEGIGVQPMIANVNISFKFIGASSLESPINKLQNALSFNYYANSQVYDVRADYVVLNNGATLGSRGMLVNGKTSMSNAQSSETTITTNAVTTVNQEALNNKILQSSQEQQPTDDGTPKFIGIAQLKSIYYDNNAGDWNIPILLKLKNVVNVPADISTALGGFNLYAELKSVDGVAYQSTIFDNDSNFSFDVNSANYCSITLNFDSRYFPEDIFNKYKSLFLTVWTKNSDGSKNKYSLTIVDNGAPQPIVSTQTNQQLGITGTEITGLVPNNNYVTGNIFGVDPSVNTPYLNPESNTNNTVNNIDSSISDTPIILPTDNNQTPTSLA